MGFHMFTDIFANLYPYGILLEPQLVLASVPQGPGATAAVNVPEEVPG